MAVMNGVENGVQLPDPTIDLHWDDFQGPITAFFNQKAKEHPDRICVVETASGSSPRRDFTYQQICEASNILANHLITNGIFKGDVVMCYAHRGVDLVVAIMGILKAGAAFSVIDPLYPPDRQVIYLDVAHPRALIVIEKATQEAGPLSEKVREFIKEKLNLATEVPGLQLQDDGSLFAGRRSGSSDIFENVGPEARVSPDVDVYPDDPPTLSFTSGSEGRPKGVAGRHYSLPKYFPWMAKRFHLSEHDRFTMLSGIAHDPIQRDVFTPLFLGATLLIPHKDDIAHEKLAQWMRREEATVSHLTPAMGQILVGGAVTTIPSFHHVFFVGDLLLKRDCRKLQELAPNVFITNMYGTTETQRSVSYYEIPSRAKDPGFLDNMPDVIPAGSGMIDVQLLIVNREDKTKQCAVDEIGEIYVRAGGLAEGYLGQPDLNKTKFVANWFVSADHWLEREQQQAQLPEPWRKTFKIRDRMYRTGDLGKYMADGNVAVVGRADDQVKIRGFRIELGEIDTHLSRHELIRENVTLVRRDKDEELTLVSYFVPEMSKWRSWMQQRGKQTLNPQEDESMVGLLKQFQDLRFELRDYLKSKLPSYAVPTVLVPLIRMPLTPNGKVDRRALPFPEPSQMSLATRRPSFDQRALSDTEKKLASIWAKHLSQVFSSRTIAPTDSFFDLGGHSLVAQYVLLDIRKAFPGSGISISTLFQCPTLRRFAAEIDRNLDPLGLRLETADEGNRMPVQEEYYSNDREKLKNQLPTSFPESAITSGGRTVLLTGATGFLGSHILDQLVRDGTHFGRIIVHTRSDSPQDGVRRIRNICKAYALQFDDRVTCITGDLSAPKLGLDQSIWDTLAKDVDVIIHNGARVHWVLDYSTLRPSNVLSTLELLKLASVGKGKEMLFVSSTAVLDTDFYLTAERNGDSFLQDPISEEDDLARSAKGLATGYGQTKWVCEGLMRDAGNRGLKGAIVRPGYVLGESRTGTTIIDDFLVRLLKGCLQLHSYPELGFSNYINAMPVDGVACLCVAAAIAPPAQMTVLNAAARSLTFDAYLALLPRYGYDVHRVSYDAWRLALNDYVRTTSERADRPEHALLPLYHLAVSDLPNDSRSPPLDNTNARAVLRNAAKLVNGAAETRPAFAVTEELVGRYLAYLVAIGFMPPPSLEDAIPLPKLEVGQERLEALRSIGGRGAVGV